MEHKSRKIYTLLVVVTVATLFFASVGDLGEGATVFDILCAMLSVVGMMAMVGLSIVLAMEYLDGE